MDDLEVQVSAALAAADLDETDLFDAWLDVAWAHRSDAVNRGFSPEAAEQMAVALHSGLVARYFTS